MFSDVQVDIYKSCSIQHIKKNQYIEYWYLNAHLESASMFMKVQVMNIFMQNSSSLFEYSINLTE